MMKKIILLPALVMVLFLFGCTQISDSSAPDVDLTNCKSYFDGCNGCTVVDGKIEMCTEKECEVYSEPKCLKSN